MKCKPLIRLIILWFQSLDGAQPGASEEWLEGLEGAGSAQLGSGICGFNPPPWGVSRVAVSKLVSGPGAGMAGALPPPHGARAEMGFLRARQLRAGGR